MHLYWAHKLSSISETNHTPSNRPPVIECPQKKYLDISIDIVHDRREKFTKFFYEKKKKQSEKKKLKTFLNVVERIAIKKFTVFAQNGNGGRQKSMN